MTVVEASRLEGYDNFSTADDLAKIVVEASRLEGYDNFVVNSQEHHKYVVEASRLEGYDNS